MPGDFYTEGDNTFVIVPETVEIQLPKDKMEVKSYLLGISADDGKTWKFLDGAELKSATCCRRCRPN